MAAKRYGEAYDALAEAMQLAPKSAHLVYKAASAAERAGLSRRAARLFQRYIDRAPGDPQGYNALGYMLLEQGDSSARTARLIERAHELSGGKDPAILDSMGWLRWRQGDAAEAERYLRLALSLLQDPEIQLHLAEVLFARGGADEAELRVQEVLAADKDNARALELLKQNDRGR